MKRNRNRALKSNWAVLAGAAAAACLAGPGLASAATISWSGTGNGNWSDGADWTGNTPPGSTASTTNTDIANFGVTPVTTVNLDASYDVGGVTFTGAAAGYTINSANNSSLLLSNGSTVTGILTAAGTGAAQTFNVPIVIEPGATTGAATFNSGSATGDVLTLNGNITGGSTTAATTVNLAGGTTGIATGVISDAATGTGGITNVSVAGNGGKWTLSGANTYSGSTVLTSTATGVTLNVSSINSVATNAALGTVHSSASNMGAPTTVANGTIGITANLTLNYTGAGETTDRVISLIKATSGGGGGQITENGAGALTFVSNMNSLGGSAKTFTLGGNGAGGGSFQGVISDDTSTSTTFQTSVTKTGNGNWTLGGANTFTGPVTFAASGAGVLTMGNNNALGGTIPLTGLASASANTITYTAANNTNAPLVGSTLVAPGLAPDTYITAVATKAGVTTLTISSDATALTGTTGTDSPLIQMGAGSASLNLNGFTLSNRRIYMQTGANIINNNTATTAVITTDIAAQNGATPTTDQYGVGGGAGNMQIAGINGGTMNHKGTGTLTITPNAGTTNVVTLLATNGVIQMGEANALTSTSNLTFNGGTYSTGGFNQALTNLTVNAGNGTIDFGAANTGSVMTFGNLASFTGTSLTINDWIGTANQVGGTDELLFSSAVNLTPAVLAEINFTGYAPGAEALVNGAYTEVVPISVPEPASLAALGLTLGGLLARGRRTRD